MSASAYRDAVLASQPYALWPLDDHVGSAHAREIVSGLLADVVGEVAFQVNDPWGEDTAAHFDGASAVAEVEAHARPTPNFTVECWYRTDDGTARQAMIEFNQGAPPDLGAGNSPSLFVIEGQLHIMSFGGSPEWIYETERSDDGRWHHVAAVLDASGLRLYRDGQEVAHGDGSANVFLGPGHWWLGDGASYGAEGLTGDLAFVAVYDRALSAEEVDAHWQASEPEPPEPPEPEPPTPPSGPETLEYVAANGQSVTFEIERGMTGRLMPPVDIWEDVVPLTAGSRFRGARHSARNIVVPIVTEGIRYGRDELRRLVQVLDPVRGMGRLRVVGGDNAGREIPCVYQAGLEALAENYPQWSRVGLQFRATDPYWTDGNLNERNFAPGEFQSQWFPFFPIELGAVNVFARFNVVNAGDVTAWPVIDVFGPGQDFEFSDVTTGEVMTILGSVPAGRYLAITTQPGLRAVSLMPGNENWFNHLDRMSTLWGLAPGANALQIRYITNESSVRLRWALRYLAP